MADGSGLLPVLQPLRKLPNGGMKGGLLVHAADLGLYPEITQRAGGLHQRPSQKGAGRLIGSKHHVPGHILCVKLAHSGDHNAGHTSRKQMAVPPQAGEHPVIRLVAAALVQCHGKKQPPALQGIHAVIGIHKFAARWKQCLEHCPQGTAICIFGQKHGK